MVSVVDLETVNNLHVDNKYYLVEFLLRLLLILITYIEQNEAFQI